MKKSKPTKLKPIPKPSTPLQKIKTLRSLLHPLTLNLKDQPAYLIRMTQFGSVLLSLPLQFRSLLFPEPTVRQLLQHLAIISSHKQCLICIFQLIVGVQNTQIHEIIFRELLPLMEVIVATKNDLAVQWATVGLLREVIKFHKVEGKEREGMEKIIRSVGNWGNIPQYQVQETLGALKAQIDKKEEEFY